jgi:phosphate:Na+ symporter
MNITEFLIVLFAGMGLFFIGVKLIGSHLGQMTGRGFRKWILRLVDTSWSASLLGILFGAITQSANAVTFIVSSMITAGLVPVRVAMLVVIWANLGTSALVLMATVHIRLFVLSLLGVIGLGYFFNIEKSSRYRHVAAALLGVALLFLGLDFIKQGSAPLRELQGVRYLLGLAAQSYGLVFMLGAALALIAQSSATVTVVAVTMTKLGLLSMDLTLMAIYGSGLGSALSLWFMTVNVVGLARQLGYIQIFLKAVSAVLMVLLFSLERGFDLPLIKALIGHISTNPSLQGAWAYLLMQLLGCLVVTAWSDRLYRLALRTSPATLEETLSKPHYLYEEALGDAETALDLVEKEQLRQLERLLHYLPSEDRRASASAMENGGSAKLHAANRSVTAEIGEFLTELMDRTQDRGTLNCMLNFQSRNRLLTDIQDGLYRLDELLRPARDDDKAGAVAHGIVEGLDFLVLTLLDALKSQDEQDRALFLKLTADKSEVMERLRNQLLSKGDELSPKAHEALFSASSLYERIVWLLRQYCLLLNGLER